MSSPIVIAALYRFVRLDNYESLRQPLLDFMLEKQVRGTLLLAAEGINGTIAGNAAAIECDARLPAPGRSTARSRLQAVL